MKPLSIRVKGFGPHSDTFVDFSEMASPIAMQAPSGTGKTWLVESMFAALYGQFVWYDGSIYDALTQGGTGVGSLVFEFEHEGRYFKAIRNARKTGKTGTHTATLEEMKDGRSKEIAGPKVGDFKRVIEALIGDKEIALSTWFLSQNRKLDLCGQPGEEDMVARRRKTFCRALLDVDKLDDIEKRSAESMKKAKTTAEELEAQLAGDTEISDSMISATESDITSKELARDDAAGDVASAGEELEAARTRLRDAEGGDDVLKAQIDAHGLAVRDRDASIGRIDVLAGEISVLDSRSSGLEAALKDVESLSELKSKREDLKRNQEQHEDWLSWSSKVREIETSIESSEELVRSVENTPGVDKETIVLAGRLEEIRSEYRAAAESNKVSEAANAQASKAKQALISDIYSIRDKIDAIRGRLNEKPDVPFGDKCSPCPLMQEWAALPDQEQALQEESEKRDALLSEMPPLATIIDLTKISTLGAQAKAAHDNVVASKKAAESLQGYRDGVDAKKKDLDAHNLLEPHRPGDSSNELRLTNSEIERLSGATDRVHACEQASEDLKARIESMKSALNDLHITKLKVAETIQASESANKALSGREGQRSAVRDEVRSNKERVRAFSEVHGFIISEIATMNADLQQLRRRQEEQAGKRARLKALLDDIEGYADLRQCFGQKGVRQMLIDKAAPTLEAIADDLFERATGGKQRLRISTQKVLADGSTAEDFSIMVKDSCGERDVKRFSGGELQIILILFRIATAIAVGRINGHRPECMILDEACDRMDGEKSNALMGALDHLKDEIGTLIIIAHNDEVAAKMPSQIRLSKRFGGVNVSVSGKGSE